MKKFIGWFCKTGKGKSTLYPGQLTKENAQKITDAALEAKTIHWGEMLFNFALEQIRLAAERAEYSIYYSIYTNGPIEKEIDYRYLTRTQTQKVEEILYNKLKELGYYIELSYHGPQRMITISWKSVD